MRQTLMDVRLFIVELDGNPGDLAVLDSEERRRAERFVKSQVRDRFIAAHTAMRHVLAKELGIAPAAVPIQRRRDGKPIISSVKFSLAHSGDLALVAVTRDGEVGVDIELLAHAHRAKTLNGAHLTPDESRVLEAFPERARAVTALAHWTRKEAYLKGTGTGLRVDPRTLHLTLERPRDGRQTPASPWSVIDVLLPRAVGAVAAAPARRGDDVRLLVKGYALAFN
jgi:4'-phosphopantetheinyl transferase